ncbi:helix-turn-helix transcriptional regulator [Kiritimatiella glycovorans]|nr:AraC family transcriptional regulator [Kiritimatiella glycovorans]
MMNGTTPEIPGGRPHRPPAAAEQERLSRFRPYVRQAHEGFRPAWRIGTRRLFDFLLIHVLEGEIRFKLGDRRFTARAGDLVWVPPDTPHAMRGPPPGTRLQYTHFDLEYDPARSHWSANLPGGVADLSPWRERVHPPVEDPVIGHWCGRLRCRNTAIVEDILRRVVLEYNQVQVCGLRVSGLMTQLIGHLLHERRADSPLLDARHARAVEEAMDHIQRGFREPLRVEALARRARLSPSHFRRLFRAHCGRSPRTFQLEVRMRAACDYLIYSSLNVSEIAHTLGFANVHNFSRAFSRAMGRSPTAFRREGNSG